MPSKNNHSRLKPARNSKITSESKAKPSYSEHLESAIRIERKLLACVFTHKDVVANVEESITSDFFLSDHRALWRAAVKLHGEGLPIDSELLYQESKVDLAYIAGLVEEIFSLTAFNQYVAAIHAAARERRYASLYEELGNTSADDRPRVLEQLQQLSLPVANNHWQQIFHTIEEIDNAPPLDFAINGFLQEGGLTFIAGLPGHGKTLVMMAMAKALLDGEPLFGYLPFAVPRRASRVLYLVPECGLSSFKNRLELLRLYDYIRSGQLLIRTLSSKEEVSLTDPRMLKAVENAHVFLDTAVRFMEGSENDVEAARVFAQTMFQLTKAGARSITGAHHAPKSFADRDYMILENVVRGSGDLGAAIVGGWGVRQIDLDKNRIYVQNIKPRDFAPCGPFILEGRPHLEESGQFRMTDLPGYAGELASHITDRGGRPEADINTQQVSVMREMQAQGKGVRTIAKQLNVSKSTVHRILGDKQS